MAKRCLVYGWATKSASAETNKKTSATQRGSEHDNIMNERRMQPSTEQKKKRRTHWQIQTILTNRNQNRTRIFVHA